MLIQKNVKITIRDNEATLDEGLYFYRNDRNINVLFEIYNFNFDFLDGESNGVNYVSVIDPSYSTIKIIKPNGEQLVVPKCPINNNLVHFYISSDLIDEVNEVGIYQLQITLHGKQMFSEEEDSRITIPPVTFEVIEPIFIDDTEYGETTVKGETDGDINITKISDCNVHNEHLSRQEIKEGTNLYEWMKGDWITDSRLNSIHDNILKLYKKTEETDASTIIFGLNGLETVQDALVSLLTPALTINSFGINISTFMEIGISVNFCNLTWSYNKNTIVEQKLSDGINTINLDVALRTYRYATPFNTNKTFTISAYDGRETKTRSISVRFCNRVFWGIGRIPTEYNKAFLDGLNYDLSESRNKTITVQPTSNQYIFYSVPSRYGECVFSVSGFIGGFEKVATISYTNQYNHTENYDIYKSDNPNLGNTTVVIQ